VYRINLQKNEAVVVQQQWFREAFSKLTGFDKRKIIVARPELLSSGVTCARDGNNTRKNIQLFYPAAPRPHKNFEVLMGAMILVAKLNVRLVVTINGTENAYAKTIKKKYGKAENTVFAGFMSLEEVHQQYACCDALVFPSKLETWGLPLSEFRRYGRPILAADLPYAWEVLAGYAQACYFRPDDAHALADLIRTMVERGALPFKCCSISYDPPFATSWEELLPLLGL
jgi:glycosyltransferase involved in cell wall biosynthesis